MSLMLFDRFQFGPVRFRSVCSEEKGFGTGRFGCGRMYGYELIEDVNLA